ncbi:MAG: TlyA family RNA methyltransferase [Candidatus Eremiobacteraeota bacterium]|nr:TlyA family RNA methyltransferase [Candidatus Eremiobacteraeota bacterium]
MTRSQARSLILEGRVRIDGIVATKAGQSAKSSASIEVERPRRFVSRGGEKLERALDDFAVDVRGLEALDVGASTGGFTDCLLQRGASHVTAVDVGYGQLAWRLRNDPRVRVIERTNFRLLSEDAFPRGFDLIVVDASFISVRTIVARARAYLRRAGTMVALVKPQFEAGRKRLVDGVVRDFGVLCDVLREVRDALVFEDLIPVALTPSPLRGPAGNREFFVELRHEGIAFDDARVDAVLAEVAPA